jgi:hypothetical protein
MSVGDGVLLLQMEIVHVARIFPLFSRMLLADTL